MRNYLSHFSMKIYVVGTQKNCLNVMVLLSTQKNKFRLTLKENDYNFMQIYFSLSEILYKNISKIQN